MERLSKKQAEEMLNSAADPSPVPQEGPSMRDQLKAFLDKTKADIRYQSTIKPQQEALDFRSRYLKGEDTDRLERALHPEPKAEESEEEYLERIKRKQEEAMDMASMGMAGMTRYAKEAAKVAPKAANAVEESLRNALQREMMRDAVENVPANIEEKITRSDFAGLRKLLQDKTKKPLDTGSEKKVFSNPVNEQRLIKRFEKQTPEEAGMTADHDIFIKDADREAKVFAALKDQQYNPNTRTYRNIGGRDYQMQDKVNVATEGMNTIPYERELEAILNKSGVQNDTIELMNPANIGLKDGKPMLIDAGGMDVPKMSPEAKQRYLKTVKALKK